MKSNALQRLTTLHNASQVCPARPLDKPYSLDKPYLWDKPSLLDKPNISDKPPPAHTNKRSEHNLHAT